MSEQVEDKVEDEVESDVEFTEEQSEQAQSVDDIDLAAQQMRGNLWVDSILLNYTEELDVVIPNPADSELNKRVLRRVSMGITVKSDNRAPIKILHRAASKSLNHIFEIEKEHWLDEEKMKLEIERVKSSLTMENTKESVE